MIFQFEHESYEKTRKSLFFSSIAVLVVSNFKIKNDDAQILGLKIQISHESIINFGQLVVGFLFLALLLRMLPLLLGDVLENIDGLAEKSMAPLKEQIVEIEYQMEHGHPPDAYYYEPDPWDQALYDEQEKWRKIKKRFATMRLFADRSAIIVLDIGVTIILGIFALMYPNVLSHLL
ncbi:hypothetical protein KBY24_08235 [Ruegeria pomeroyi]|nr:hypothetical protein [Ruegeria pomeroyi]